MLTIYLARHGQDEDNAAGILNGHRDTKLTALGIKQAKDLAISIVKANIRLHAAYSSPLSRASSTGRAIMSLQGAAPFIIMQELIERDYGVLTGRPLSDIEPMCAPNILKTGNVTYTLDPPGGESFERAYVRAQEALNEITFRRSDGNVLIATHGDLGKMLFAAYYGIPWMNVLTMFHFGNSELVKLSPVTKPEEAKVFSREQHNA